MMKRGEFNFALLFAIFVGGAILVLAIYGATKGGDTQRQETDTKIAKEISILTDPLQAGFSEGRFGSITFNKETRINNFCYPGSFGKHEISVSTRSSVGKEWNLAGSDVSITNKYIFSENSDVGKKYYVFSKPFEFPYKINDLLFITTQNYCFLGAPDRISEEIDGMGIPNIEVGNCTLLNSVNVCFGSGDDCDITIIGTCMSNCDTSYDEGRVEKSGESLNYVGNLMYAGIFSSEDIYNCNIKRLMYRTAKIAQEFMDKEDLMDARGCDTNLRSPLMIWGASTINASSDEIISLNSHAKDLERKNNQELCGIWG
jgi:hypothetical protein